MELTPLENLTKNVHDYLKSGGITHASDGNVMDQLSRGLYPEAIKSLYLSISRRQRELYCLNKAIHMVGTLQELYEEDQIQKP